MSSNETYSNETRSGIAALFVGSFLAIFFPLIGFVALVANRTLRVKRQHIISINICFSLIIYYVGFLVSLIVAEQNNYFDETPDIRSYGCITGAVLVMLGWFCVHTWLLINWVYLALIVKQRVSKHISKFLLKSAVPAYGCSLIFLITIVLMSTSQRSTELYNIFCWYGLTEGNSTEWVFGVFAVLAAAGIIGSAVVCCIEFTCKQQKNVSAARAKKTKKNAARLSILTLVMIATSAIHITWWWKTKHSNPESNNFKNDFNVNDLEWLTILHGVFIGIEGITATIYLFLPVDDYKNILEYCTALIKCQDPSTIQHRNINSTLRGSKQIDNNNMMEFSMSSGYEDRPVKFEPREDVSRVLTVVPSNLADPYPATLPMDKNRAKARASTLKAEKNGNVTSTSKSNNTLLEGKTNKKRGIRASFRFQTKPNSSNPSSQLNKARTPPVLTPMNSYNFNRDSKISMSFDHERKTSF